MLQSSTIFVAADFLTLDIAGHHRTRDGLQMETSSLVNDIVGDYFPSRDMLLNIALEGQYSLWIMFRGGNIIYRGLHVVYLWDTIWAGRHIHDIVVAIAKAGCTGKR